MMPAATVSLVVPSITSNVYAMYILSNHYLCVYLFLLLFLFHCLLICYFYRMVLCIYCSHFCSYPRQISQFIVDTIKNHLILTNPLHRTPFCTRYVDQVCDVVELHSAHGHYLNDFIAVSIK